MEVGRDEGESKGATTEAPAAAVPSTTGEAEAASKETTES